MTIDDAQTRTDAADLTDAIEIVEADDYPTGSLASPTRIRL
ncbi:hypothetical protein [Nocardioides sp.]|nr:hypothetical protein [Nocardioides sp.]MDO9457530.1 hypothetical protein [Nocardioides sp.]